MRSLLRSALRARPLRLVPLAVVAGCAALGEDEPPPPPPTPAELAREAGVELSEPPFENVAMQWKERVAEPYVFLEHHGDPAGFGGTMRALIEVAVRERVESTGPPFALYPQAGRPRACLPVAANPISRRIGFDRLPQAMVGYAVVSGPYPEAVAAVPGLLAAMAERGWSQRGPVRAIYLVNPAEVATYDRLATELQVPWAPSAP